MENKIINVDFANAMTDLKNPRQFGEDNFKLKIGSTTYEISTHFSPDGRESVWQQFKDLIEKEGLI